MSAIVDMVGAQIAGVACLRAGKVPGTFVWRCHCGEEFVRRGAAVRLAAKRRGSTSCGCAGVAARSANGKANRVHGLTVGPWRRLYDVWRQMHRRCGDEQCADFSAYGGRGIRVCAEWSDVETFVSWARASGYRVGLTIDRVDVNDGYRPSNCRWVESLVQGSNIRKNRLLTVAGRTMTVSAWARETGLHVQTILRRLNAGWSADRCVSSAAGRAA